MTDEQVFDYLFRIAARSKDPDGVVAAALVRGDKILTSVASADNGIIHAEQRVIEYLKSQNLYIEKSDILYCTLEPCSKRNKPGILDCCSQIIDGGIKNVVFGAKDANNKDVTANRLAEAGVKLSKVSNHILSHKSLELFNTTVNDPLKKKP